MFAPTPRRLSSPDFCAAVLLPEVTELLFLPEVAVFTIGEKGKAKL